MAMNNALPMPVADIVNHGFSYADLATAAGVHRTAAYHWSLVPPRHVRAIASLTGISEHALRPDLWGDIPGEQAA